MTLSFDDFFPQDILAFTSGRDVDFSLPEGEATFNEQQKRVLDYFRAKDVVNIRQVHEDHILVIDKEYKPERGAIAHADGAVTNHPGKALAVRTADCLPVFLCDPVNKAIGLVHAGWKGTRKQISRKAVEMMSRRYGSVPAKMKIAFGPCIRSCCYAVGEEFKQYFPGGVIERNGRLYFDLPLANEQQLLAAGVLKSNVLDPRECTCCHDQYFSYRREGDRAGRMISLMMLKEDRKR